MRNIYDLTIKELEDVQKMLNQLNPKEKDVIIDVIKKVNNG